MMTAEFQGDTELTSQQKYHRLRPKEIVEVRLLSHAGADEKWFRAKIKDTNKEGAYCQIIDGPHTRFWHWREIRVCEATTGLATATLGEIAKTHLKPVAELPRRDPLPAPPALRAALVVAQAPSPPAPLVMLNRAPQQQQQQAQPDETPPTAGEMIRQARLRAALTQDGLAIKLGKLMGATVDNRRVSSLETGFRAPTENEQLAIVEALSIDLAQLLAACERDAVQREKELKLKRSRESAQRRREEKARLEGREIAHRTSAYRPREAAPNVPPPTRAPAATKAVRDLVTKNTQSWGSTQTLEDLIDALIAIVPMPSDADERKNWFRCARELFALSGGR
jgi:transcriptional regulator with XRE-family HTH domain